VGVYIYVGLDFAEFQQNMKDVCANIHLTRDDFDIITENGKVRILMMMMPFIQSLCKVVGLAFCGSFIGRVCCLLVGRVCCLLVLVGRVC
jgi:hypothetical protein